MPLYFATSNTKKLSEARAILPKGIAIKHTMIDIEEIQSLDVVKVAADKAARAYAKLRKPVAVEDTGLYLKGLNGFPGALVKFFLESFSSEEICRMLDGKSRKAEARTALCLCTGPRNNYVFVGSINGTISKRPAGAEGFGFDPIFVPEGHSRTLGELGIEAKNGMSMRRKALMKLARHLRSQAP